MSKKPDAPLGHVVELSPLAFDVWAATQPGKLLSAPIAPCALPQSAHQLVKFLRLTVGQAETVSEILDAANEIEASIEPNWSGAGSRPSTRRKEKERGVMSATKPNQPADIFATIPDTLIINGVEYIRRQPLSQPQSPELTND